jgi:hypothetical protein
MNLSGRLVVEAHEVICIAYYDEQLIITDNRPRPLQLQLVYSLLHVAIKSILGVSQCTN